MRMMVRPMMMTMEGKICLKTVAKGFTKVFPGRSSVNQ